MKKIIYTLSFACALLFAPKVIIAQTFKSGNIYYKVISPNTPRTVAVTYSSTAGEKYSGSVNIPASVSYSGASYSVVSIDSAAFSACTGLTSVTIPSTVRYIGNYAFRNCSALSLPNFAALTALDSIGYSAFYNCTSFLGALNLPNSLIRIGDNAFDSCTGLTNALVLPSSLKWLGNQVFFYCTGLTGALVLPNNLSHIGVAPFEQCAGIITPTETLTIPDSVTYIAFFAFLGFNNLKTINFNAKKCETMADLTDQSHEKVAFYNCNAVKTINIGANVTKIPNYGFSKLTTVQSIKSDAITPPQIYAQTFKDIATNIPVTVSCNSAAVYSAATYWNNFTNIQGFGSVSVPYDLQAANESASIKLQWQGSATSYKIYRNNTLIATVG
ncbi:MAG: leucine-rich repeat domain-containing protein, partial [Paludibacter sp.]|nr:leucine-rich repeat domain-containing protein [Paludibacter sp.]